MSAKVVAQLASVAVIVLIASVDRVSAQSVTAQTGSSSAVFSPYPAVPRREIAINLSAWDLSTAAGVGPGATYTRNLDDYVGIEAALDVGADHSRPFAVAIAQFRMNRESLPGLRHFVTFGVARAFADRDRLDVPEGRALTVGVGLQGVMRDSALRVGVQVMLFERALAARATCAFVKGFD